jgi:hypothetical protein
VQIVINAKRNVVQIALQKYFVVQDVLHEICNMDMNMGAGTPAKKPKFFWLGKVRLFPHLAIPVGKFTETFLSIAPQECEGRKERKNNETDKKKQDTENDF